MATSGSISSIGIGSGLDASSIISKLMSLEAQPLARLKTQATGFNTQLSNFGKLQGHMAALRDSTNALNTPSLWSGTGATVSDASAVKVSTGTAAPAGSYSVLVNRLAGSQTVTSGSFSSKTAALSDGTLTIELGGYDASGAFSAKDGSSALSITIADGNNSLEAVRDRINNAAAGVVAGIVNDANGARLTLRSRETGAENAFRISVSEAVDDGDATTGLSALAFDAGNPSSPMTRTASAANADVSINGIAVSSASNTLTDVIEGLTLTVNKASQSPVLVDVASDTATIKTAVTNFVTAFNTAASFIRSQTAYNAESKTAGALQADQGTLTLQSQLRAVINEAFAGTGSFSRLSDIGIALKSDGTLEVNDKKLDSGLNNLEETRKLLTFDGNGSADSGFARRFKRLADATLGVEGMFDVRTSSLRGRLDRNNKAQGDQQNRLDAVQARLQRQYTALDTTMAQLGGLSNYMAQQIAMLNNR